MLGLLIKAMVHLFVVWPLKLFVVLPIKLFALVAKGFGWLVWLALLPLKLILLPFKILF